MNLKEYMAPLSKNEKTLLAERLATTPGYISQLASGHRKAGAGILMRIGNATGGDVTPEELRPDL